MVARRSRLRRAAVLALLASALFTAIAVACGPGDIGDLTAGRPDGAAIDTGAPDTLICLHAGAPERPTTPDGPNVDRLVFAMEGLRFDTDDTDAGGLPTPRGIDLDQTCTCPEVETCLGPPDAASRCDLTEGRDNVAGPLLTLGSTLAQGLSADSVASQMRKGRFNILLSLQGWNGQPDDPSVVVGLQQSGGLEGTQSDAGVDDDAGRGPRPKFDGTDVWTVTPATVLGGGDLIGADCRMLKNPCIPARVDTAAYVRGGVIVAHLELPVPVRLVSGLFLVDFTAATVMARIEPTGASYRISGEITGRWPVTNILQAFARLPNPSNGRPLCASDAGLEIFGLVKANVCGSADLVTNPALDRTGAKCDALSNAVSFKGAPASLGTIFALPVPPDECPDFKDGCSN